MTPTLPLLVTDPESTDAAPHRRACWPSWLQVWVSPGWPPPPAACAAVAFASSRCQANGPESCCSPGGDLSTRPSCRSGPPYSTRSITHLPASSPRSSSTKDPPGRPPTGDSKASEADHRTIRVSNALLARPIHEQEMQDDLQPPDLGGSDERTCSKEGKRTTAPAQQGIYRNVQHHQQSQEASHRSP